MPSDLLARCAAVKDQAERRLQVGRLQEDAARYARAARMFDVISADATTLSASLAAHRAAEIDFATPPDIGRELRLAAATLREKAPTARGAEMEDLAVTADRALRAASSPTTAALGVARARWIESQPRPNAAFLTALRPSAPGEVAATESALAEFDALAGDGAAESVGIKRLSEAAIALRDSYAALAMRAPRAVRSFLEQVPNGVRLSNLDPEVIGWLKAHGADSAFTVELRK